jgi:hypothetical protein
MGIGEEIGEQGLVIVERGENINPGSAKKDVQE